MYICFRTPPPRVITPNVPAQEKTQTKIIGTAVPSTPFKKSDAASVSDGSTIVKTFPSGADLLRKELTREISHADRIRAIKESVRRTEGVDTYSFY